MRRLPLLLGLLLVPMALPAQDVTTGRDVKYIRDAAEYATLTRQVFRQALAAVRRGRDSVGKAAWGVVLDVDETTLDNSVYELERLAYDLPFDNPSWTAWVERREAGMVPGVRAFVDGVRGLGGKVAYVSNRDDITQAATRENLEHFGLFNGGDLICLKRDSADTKARRRSEIARGEGTCAWPGQRVGVLVYVGDAMGDFPGEGEPLPEAGQDEAFGSRFFLLPNPMYGGWVRKVTRK
jgi:5'-nucleotidase (lipoprotein e(P4) family)